MRNRSEVAVFLAVVLSVMVLGALILRQNQQVRTLLVGRPRTIIEGARLQPLNGYEWGSHRATLIIALRSGCPFCQASAGFYGRIGDVWKGEKLKVYPLVLYPDAANEVEPEVRKFQKLVNMDYLKIGVLSTPTVLLVDSQGNVLRKWTGELPVSQEEDLLAAARGLSARLQ
jgi:hypothetical protein